MMGEYAYAIIGGSGLLYFGRTLGGDEKFSVKLCKCQVFSVKKNHEFEVSFLWVG